MRESMLIIAGGGIGAFLRFAVISITHNKFFEGKFPFGTLTVNLIGSFIIGFMWEIFEKYEIPGDVKSFIFIGLLGAFTTFSTYTLDSLNLFRDGEVKLALLNMAGSNIAGIFLVFAGILVSRQIQTIIS